MILLKINEYLEGKLKWLEKQRKDPSTYSYQSGRIDELEDIIEWINNIPSKDKIEEIIRKIEETNSQDSYSFMNFNYQELLKLKELL